MANNTNIMSIAPNQPSTTPRRISPGTQPKYKPAARAGKKTFGSTLDQIHAKLDELKQNIQDLQETSQKIAQVDDEQKPPLNETKETEAQGTSDTPQEAEQAIRNEELGNVNDSEIIAEKDIKPADIFFVKDKPALEIKTFVAEPPQKIPTEIKLPVAENFVEPTAPAEEPVNLDTSADLVDEQSPANLLAASSMAYLFGINKETLLAKKTESSAETPKVDAVPNLMSLMPQENKDNAQSMLNLLGGRAWRPVEVQAQPVEVQPVQVQPTLQAQPLEVQPLQVQPTLQAQPLEVQPLQLQPTLQAQPVDVQPLQLQPTVQAQPVDVQPVQVQPTLQAQPVDVQPLQLQPTVQAQPVNVQPVQVQPTVQAQPIEVQPLQVQPTVQAQPVEIQPLQVQPTVQAKPVEIQPLQVQPTLQAQPVDVQPLQIQPTLQAKPVEIQPLQLQPTVQAQPVEIQPLQVQPTLQAKPVEVQPLQVQPSVEAQPLEVQPLQVQPSVEAQPVEVQPVQVQPTVQAQPVDVQPLQVQPTLQAQPVDVQPLQVQPTVQAQPVDVQPLQVQPTLQAQPANVQPAQIQSPIQSQPIIAPQKADERPAQQILSEMLGVNVQVEDAPTAAPVTPPQSTPQQFNQGQQQQPQQQDAQNFQNQLFQATTADAPQVQQIATGGEIFTVPLTTTNDVSQPQPPAPIQTPDEPPTPPQEDFDVPAQIVRQARLIRTTENTEMVIKLNPEHLGELTLRVSVSANGAVNASFHSDNAQVRTIIENSLVQLRQELNDAGLKVENVDVYAGLSEGGLMNGQGGQAWQQGRQQRQGNRQIDLNSLEREIDSTAPVNQSTDDGVDYSV